MDGDQNSGGIGRNVGGGGDIWIITPFRQLRGKMGRKMRNDPNAEEGGVGKTSNAYVTDQTPLRRGGSISPICVIAEGRNIWQPQLDFSPIPLPLPPKTFPHRKS